MDVEKRLRLEAEPLRREIEEFDAQATLEKFFSRLDVDVDVQVGERAQDREPAARQPLPHPPLTQGYKLLSKTKGDTTETKASEFEEELVGLIDQVRDILWESETPGPMDHTGLRRIAELLELLEGDEAAVVWWHRAAKAGDSLAIELIADGLL